MKIEPVKRAESPYKDLTPLEKGCYVLAVIVSFAGIFVWFVKILFF